jgi:hypothetical protein
MTTAEDVEKAIEQLSPHELARFRAWFEEFDAQQFDAAIERDARDGKLDTVADEALAAHRAGRSQQHKRRHSLGELVAGITPDNRHDEID